MHVIDKKLLIHSKHYMVLCKYLQSAGGVSRLVGGIVRDSLLSIPTSDVDIITTLLPSQVINTLGKSNIKTIPTGIKFGTVTAFIEDKKFEITTLRKDLSCDGRHATVKFTDDFELDALRRDFTINALSYCPFKHKIYDYFTGISDLKSGVVRFIGKPSKRILEDYLRILRFFRFSSRFAKNKLHQESLDACIALKHKLSMLSKERIKLETDLLLSLNSPYQTLELMYSKGILEVIFPKVRLDTSCFTILDSFAEQTKISIPLIIKYAVLLKNIKNLTTQILLEYKFSRQESKILLELIQLQTINTQKQLIFELKKIWVSKTKYETYFLFASTIDNHYDTILTLYLDLSTRVKPVFPVNGNDIITLGYEGKDIGKYIDALQEQWIISDFTLNKDELLDLINYAK